MSASEQILDAVRSGDPGALRALLDAHPGGAGAVGGDGVSAVLTALYHGRRDALALLLERGPALGVAEAAATGEVERLSALLDADPGAVARLTPDGWTPLHLAAFFGAGEAVRLLLSRGADANARSANAMANTPLHAAAAGPLGADGVRLLLDAGADPDARQHGGFTALHAAAQRGDEALVALLLERGASPAAATADGRTAADLAREAGHHALAERLSRPA